MTKFDGYVSRWISDDETQAQMGGLFSANDAASFGATSKHDVVSEADSSLRKQAGGAEKALVCFLPGTQIVTPRGEIAIEKLRSGDRVFTRDNGLQQIRWIGQTIVSGEELSNTQALAPIRIRKGALGNNTPDRDLMVSPNHRVLLLSDIAMMMFDENEILVEAKHLVGLHGIERVAVPSAHYIHLMLDHHEVILANGVWSESFQPTEASINGLSDAEKAELLALFPSLAHETGIQAFASARRALKGHEAKTFVAGFKL